MNADYSFIEYLYKKYYFELKFLRKQQKARIEKMNFMPHYDDIEAEILYMTIREFKPAYSIEFSPYYGYSTTWILAALNKNNHGVLKSFDIVDYSFTKVSETDTENRWELIISDVTKYYSLFDYSKIDFAFIDSDHSKEFAQKYIQEFLKPLHESAKSGCKIVPIITHDIYSWETGAAPTEEGEEVLNFLKEMNIGYFAPSCFYEDFQKVKTLRQSLGIADYVHDVEGNPSILYFLGV